MRLKDDEVRVLRGLASGGKIEAVTDPQVRAILKAFRYHGIVDADGKLTPRGLHVVAKLPPVPASEQIEVTSKTDERTGTYGSVQGSQEQRVARRIRCPDD